MVNDIPSITVDDLEYIVAKARLRQSNTWSSLIALRNALAVKGLPSNVMTRYIEVVATEGSKSKTIKKQIEALEINGELFHPAFLMKPCSWADVFFYHYEQEVEGIKKADLIENQTTIDYQIQARVKTIARVCKGSSANTQAEEDHIKDLENRILDVLDTQALDKASWKPSLNKKSPQSPLTLFDPPPMFVGEFSERLNFILRQINGVDIMDKIQYLSTIFTTHDKTPPLLLHRKQTCIKGDTTVEGTQIFFVHENTGNTIPVNDTDQWSIMTIKKNKTDDPNNSAGCAWETTSKATITHITPLNPDNTFEESDLSPDQKIIYSHYQSMLLDHDTQMVLQDERKNKKHMRL